MMKMKAQLAVGIALIVLLVSLAPVAASDTAEEEFADLVEELEELVAEFEDSDEDFNDLLEEAQEFVGEFDEEFQELTEEFQELATSFTGEESIVFVGPPEGVSVVDGILQLRGIPVEATFQGSLISWTNTVVVNDNVNLATGDEVGWGTFAIDLTWGDLRGTFEGRHMALFTVDSGLLRFIGHGGGDFEGMGLMGMAIQDPNTVGLPIENLIWLHEVVILNLDFDEEDEKDEDDDD